eukprot:m.190645 g.190645  ORF g.190645 m.190645 type:complete len:84 (+) comp15642_c0_seq4:4040-4291(+)
MSVRNKPRKGMAGGALSRRAALYNAKDLCESIRRESFSRVAFVFDPAPCFNHVTYPQNMITSLLLWFAKVCELQQNLTQKGKP